MPRSQRPSNPWGAALAIAAALLACRAREGERCVCAEDCGEGLLCVAASRVLAPGECSPAVGEDANPGVCLSAEEAAEDGGAGGPPEIFMDLGSKLDFEPGPLPDPDTETGVSTSEGTSTSGGTSEGTSSSGGTTDASTGSTSEASTGSSSGGSTDAASTGSSGGSTGGSSGSTSVGT